MWHSKHIWHVSPYCDSRTHSFYRILTRLYINVEFLFFCQRKNTNWIEEPCIISRNNKIVPREISSRKRRKIPVEIIKKIFYLYIYIYIYICIERKIRAFIHCLGSTYTIWYEIRHRSLAKVIAWCTDIFNHILYIIFIIILFYTYTILYYYTKMHAIH